MQDFILSHRFDERIKKLKYYYAHSIMEFPFMSFNSYSNKSILEILVYP